MQQLAAFAMTFGPAAAVASYVALSGWYEQIYHNKEIVLWIRYAALLPVPITILCRQSGNWFEQRCGTRTAYFIQLTLMQLVVAGLMVLWMLLPNRLPNGPVLPILCFGVVLSACTAPFPHNAAKVADAMDPGLDWTVQLGAALGTAVPVLSVLFVGCTPESGLDRVRLVVLVPMAICLAGMLLLSLLHLRTALFDGAFQLIEEDASRCVALQDRIGYSLRAFLEFKKAGTGADAGFFTVPVWIWYWVVAQAIGNAVDVGLLGLQAFFGDATMTHDLALLSLMACACGRVVPLCVDISRFDDTSPMHAVIVACWYVRILLGSLLAATLAGLFAPPTIFIQMIWFGFHFNSVMQVALTEKTTASNVPGSARENMMNVGLLCNVASIFLGMSCALWVNTAMVTTTAS